MPKAEAVKFVRSSASTWFAEVGQPPEPDFDDYLKWALRRRSDLLRFRSVMGPREDLEMVWAKELKQRWRY